jgi:hypothetical protein
MEKKFMTPLPRAVSVSLPAVLLLTMWTVSRAAAAPTVRFFDFPDRLVIALDDAPLGEYLKSGDERTSRPFFRHLHAPSGEQVSINNPPGEGEPDDHHGYHVGLFQAFGRMGKYDTWRCKNRVVFAGYAEAPTGGPGRGTFAVKNRYLRGRDPDDNAFCTEVVRYTILVRPQGTLLLWDSALRSDTEDLELGDQEEMGLVIRVNAPMNVAENALNRKGKRGRILNSRGDRNERGVRNQKQADWCDYSGWVGGRFAGVQLMAHPENMRAPWWHARDYGVLACNPFARKDLGGGEPSRIQVDRGETFRIRYGILLHAGERGDSVDLAATYTDYKAVSAQEDAAAPEIHFEKIGDGLLIRRGDEPLARYVYGDQRTTRPFFKEVHSPGGHQASMHNPPKYEADHDHGSVHPGLFQAFGDISGNDHWRMGSPVLHGGYIESPHGGPGRGSFGVLNHCLTRAGEIYATETARYTFLTRPQGTLILWESTFRSDTQDLVFGDQQELGMAIRVNALMNINAGTGGRILNSRGQLNEKGENNVYGKPAQWCDYSGPVDGKFVGVCLMPHPDNFRVSRFHARGYGVLVANPFAQRDFRGAFPKGVREYVEKNRTVVKKGEPFRLRWGILLHTGKKDGDVDLEAAYQDYLSIIQERVGY